MKLTDRLFFYPESGMLDCNTYVIKDDINIIIDAGSAQSLSQLAGDLHHDGIDIQDINLIINTHLHPDHCWANEAIRKLSSAKIMLHPLQKEYYGEVMEQATNMLGLDGLEFEIDSCFEDSILDAGHMTLEFIHSPGHSPDSICFYERQEKILLAGDVVFAQNTGRVDLPGGNAAELKQSIETLSRLEIEYLLPGHINVVKGIENVKKNFEFVKQYIFPWL